MAVAGVNVDARAVFIVEELPAPSVLPEERASASNRPQQSAAPARTPELTKGVVDTRTHVSPASRHSAPHLESLELQRLNRDQLQCCVVIEVDGSRRSGFCEAGDEHGGVNTLVAQATLAALHHDKQHEWRFEGAADVIIGGQRHVCVSLKNSADSASYSGAAPVHESVEQAVANAVLRAVVPGAPHDLKHRLVYSQ
jgi:hypothetical protein